MMKTAASGMPPPVPARAATGARAEVISGDLLFRMLEGCKRKYKAGGRRRRVSYTHPLFKELLEAFSALTDRGGKCARVEVWRLVALRAEAEVARETGYFWSLDVSDANVDEASRVQIEKDIARSGSLWDSLPEDQALAWRARLRHILRAYAVHDRRNGYTQGMNLFAAEFLFVTANEELSFWLIMHVCYTSRIAPDYFTADIAGLKRDVWVVQQLLEQHFPELMAHLKKCELDVSYLFIGPLLSLFCSVLPPGSTRLHQFYDVMLANGETTLFAALLSLFKMNEPSLLQQTDSSSLMDTLNLSLETMQSGEPAFMETFHRSLLQWCMALEPGTIADFRKNAPMHWCNMDLIIQMARERDQELLSSHAPANRAAPAAPSVGAGVAASPSVLSASRYRLKIFSLGDRDNGNNAQQQQAQQNTHHGLGIGGGAAAAGSEDAGSRELNLRVVWIASNLRHPFANATAEEYRQAAIATCKDILKRNGYAEILLQQHSDLGRGPGPPTSASPLLPGGAATSPAASPDAVLAHALSSASLPAPASPAAGLGAKLSRQDASNEHFGDVVSTADVWRAPDSYLGLRALLEGLMDALMEASREVSDENPLRLLLDRLLLCLRASRDAIPLYKNAGVLLDELCKLLGKPDAERAIKTVPWRKKLRNVFRPRRASASGAASSSPMAASGAGTSASSPSVPLGSTSSSPALSGPLSASSSSSSSLTQRLLQSGAGPSSGPRSGLDRSEARASSPGLGSSGVEIEVEDKDRQEWRTHLVLLLLARKVHAENQEIHLYEALDSETGSRISFLYEEIAAALRADIDAAIMSAAPVPSAVTQAAHRGARRISRPVSPSEDASLVQTSDTEEDVDAVDPAADFGHALDYQLRVWSVERGGSLYLSTWALAREADLRSTEKSLGAHRRFKSHAVGASMPTSGAGRFRTRGTAETPPAALASQGAATGDAGFTASNSGPNGAVGASGAVVPHLHGIKKTRSRSSPTGAQGVIERGGELPRLSREVPVSVISLQHLGIHKVREISLSNSQHWRALYWALRSNYHLTLEMSQLADVATTLSCRSLIKKLASDLHTLTYNMQAKLCDAARVDHIALQIETFHDLLSGQPADAELHANQVLLDDLSDQVKLCHGDAWQIYFGDQLATIQGQLIL